MVDDGSSTTRGPCASKPAGSRVTLADIGFMASVFAEVDQPPPFVRLRGRSARVVDRIDAGPRHRGSRGQAKRDEFDGGIGKAEGVGALVGRVEIAQYGRQVQCRFVDRDGYGVLLAEVAHIDRPAEAERVARNAVISSKISIGLRFQVREDAADLLDGNVIGAGQRGYCKIAPGLGRQHAHAEK